MKIARRWGLADAAVGVLGAMILVLAVTAASAQFLITDAHVGMLLSYLAVWVPLLGACLIACFARGSGSFVRDFGLRFRPIDILWGLSIGLLARVVAGLLEIAFYGRMGTGAVTLGDPTRDGWWWFGVVLAPVLFAPLIEELYFRGLLLRAVQRAARSGQGTGRGATAVAIVVSGAVFALVHVLQAGPGTTAIVVGLSTLVFGLAAASVAALTGRLGGAIIAHVTFNALVVVPALL